MADDPKNAPAVGTTLAGDSVGGAWYARSKLVFGDDTEARRVTDDDPLPVVDAAKAALIGALDEGAPADDIAPSGLNGRLQRLAQRLTTLLGRLPGSLGAKTAGNSLSVVLASDHGNVPINTPALAAKACPANAPTPLGAGAVGDYLDSVIIIPLSTSPGKVQIKDGAGAAIDIFMGGGGSVVTLHSFAIPIGAASQVGGWSVITGDANVKAIAVGRFTA